MLFFYVFDVVDVVVVLFVVGVVEFKSMHNVFTFLLVFHLSLVSSEILLVSNTYSACRR